MKLGSLWKGWEASYFLQIFFISDVFFTSCCFCLFASRVILPKTQRLSTKKGSRNSALSVNLNQRQSSSVALNQSQPPVPAKVVFGPRLGTTLLHAPGTKMTWVKQTPSNYIIVHEDCCLRCFRHAYGSYSIALQGQNDSPKAPYYRNVWFYKVQSTTRGSPQEIIPHF